MNGIDLNSDMGESFGRWRLGDDESLLSVVSSANVACGFHAGDPSESRSVRTSPIVIWLDSDDATSMRLPPS